MPQFVFIINFIHACHVPISSIFPLKFILRYFSDNIVSVWIYFYLVPAWMTCNARVSFNFVCVWNVCLCFFFLLRNAMLFGWRFVLLVVLYKTSCCRLLHWTSRRLYDPPSRIRLTSRAQTSPLQRVNVGVHVARWSSVHRCLTACASYRPAEVQPFIWIIWF